MGFQSSVGFTWTRLVSFRLTWIRFDSLGFTWTNLVSLGLTWIQLDAVDLSLIHLDSRGLTGSHLDSLGLTGPHLVFLGVTPCIATHEGFLKARLSVIGGDKRTLGPDERSEDGRECEGGWLRRHGEWMTESMLKAALKVIPASLSHIEWGSVRGGCAAQLGALVDSGKHSST